MGKGRLEAFSDGVLAIILMRLSPETRIARALARRDAAGDPQ